MAKAYSLRYKSRKGLGGFLDSVKYTTKDIGSIFKSKRLWGGIATSVALHGLIFLLAVYQDKIKQSDFRDDTAISDVSYDPTIPPQAQQIIQREQQFTPMNYSTSETDAPIDLSRNKVEFQSKIQVNDFSLDKGKANLTGDVIRINPNARLSTEQILASAPIDINRSIGGLGKQNPFDQIANQNIGSSIELDSRATQIGEEATKPKFETTPTEDIKKTQGLENMVGGTGWDISGDLSEKDILNGPLPRYPPWARQKGISNVKTIYEIRVSQDGLVSSTIISKRSTGYPNWDSEIKNKLGDWLFTPCQGCGTRVGYVTFKFVLN